MDYISRPFGGAEDLERLRHLYEGMRRLQALGATRVGVNTGYGNDPASRLYESVGFQRVALDYSYVKKV
ncbi:hypothetical protein KSD_62970 [Ktedonobacter sp. SOSP1-85]|uniref:hypothetical protein n=1 Tax=Ktedonobacter sp. SOSP1-85 TaxID=2778367 RepID=UPI001916A4BE|nr:hypothetical protein [Ktedonobacter sp. SOSP1-85]GHO78526.1 hypothetical protein KSD_62970 [Ktedonobacter sp. SOSP1-85]